MKPRGVPNPTRRAITVDSPLSTSDSSPPATNAINQSPAARHLSVTIWSIPGDTLIGIVSPSHFMQPDPRTKHLTATEAGKSAMRSQMLPYGADGNIYNLLEIALGLTVINQERANIPRIIIINTGTIRFDLVEGPFTLDDSFLVSPFKDAFQYIPDVPYDVAGRVLAVLNAGPNQKRRDLFTQDFGFSSTGDTCPDGTIPHEHKSLRPRSIPLTRGLHRRRATDTTPGFTTTDDFGTDGDDTLHSKIPKYPQPNDIQSKASFPADGSDPKTVDFIFLDFIAKNYVIPALQSLGAKYTVEDIREYLPVTFTTNSYLPLYAKLAWQKGVPNCPVGIGVGA
ncbi:hypothetical protein MMC29_005467 [Sticta canariensis]|nr:hypothetical protein [Sticta canariensis]